MGLWEEWNRGIGCEGREESIEFAMFGLSEKFMKEMIQMDYIT